MSHPSNPMQRTLIRVFNLETHAVTLMPADELAPGMVRARVEGVDGDVWIDSAGLHPGEYRHPPFSPPVREQLRLIHEALDEVYPQSVEEWEDGFRRDAHADREIALWLRIAAAYRRAVTERAYEPAQKRDVFAVILSCANNPREHVLNVVKLRALTRGEALQLIGLFFAESDAPATRSRRRHFRH